MVTYVLALTAFVLRLIARKKTGRSLNASDWVAAVAFVSIQLALVKSCINQIIRCLPLEATPCFLTVGYLKALRDIIAYSYRAHTLSRSSPR